MFPRRSCLEALQACVLLIRRLVGRWTMNLKVLRQYTLFIDSSKTMCNAAALVDGPSTAGLLVLRLFN